MPDSLRLYAHQAPLSMEFSRQKYWSELPSPLQGIFPTQGWNPHLLRLLHWWAGSLPLAPPGQPQAELTLVTFKTSTFCHLPPLPEASPRALLRALRLLGLRCLAASCRRSSCWSTGVAGASTSTGVAASDRTGGKGRRQGCLCYRWACQFTGATTADWGAETQVLPQLEG